MAPLVGLLLSDVLTPLVPYALSAWIERRRVSLPDWLPQAFVKAYDLNTMVVMRGGRANAESRGRNSQSFIARQLARTASSLHAWSARRYSNVRHPLLYLPLVEFRLTVPLELRSSPDSHKDLLRFAMKGIVPEPILRRRAKGMIGPRICWAFGHERERLSKLLKTSLLAELGCVEPKALLAAIDRSCVDTPGAISLLYSALSLETWLTVKCGQLGQDLWL
jgi:hypothetical protein